MKKSTIIFGAAILSATTAFTQVGQAKNVIHTPGPYRPLPIVTDFPKHLPPGPIKLVETSSLLQHSKQVAPESSIESQQHGVTQMSFWKKVWKKVRKIPIKTPPIKF